MESSAEEQPSGETEQARAATDGLQEEIERVRADDVGALPSDVKKLAAEVRESALRAAGAESIARRAVAAEVAPPAFEDGDAVVAMAAVGARGQRHLFGMLQVVRELGGAFSGFDYAGPPPGMIVGAADKPDKAARKKK